MTKEEKALLNRLFEYTCIFSRDTTNLRGVALQDKENNILLFGCYSDYNYTEKDISPIDAMYLSTKKKAKINHANSVLYMTYHPDQHEIIRIYNEGIKHVVFSGLSTDMNIKSFCDAKGIVLEQNPIEYKVPDKWWTDVFYEKAYDIVKDRKAPFTIISYNNPVVPTLKNFGVHKMTEDLNWPIFIFVRTSQKAVYEDATKNYKYVKIIDFPDTLISNAGAVRRASQKWLYSQGYTIALQGDDDCTLLTYSTRASKGDGSPKAGYVENANICKVLAMWQLAMEKAIERDNVYLSCSMPVGFSWKPDYCMSYDSYLLSRGSFTNIICWNLKGLVEDRIFYRDNPLVGLDDIDMEIRVIESGHNLCNFTWLVNSGDTMSSGQSMEILQKRFKECQDKLRSFHEHLEWVHFREKRNLDQVCVYFPGVRKWQKEQGYRNTTDYIYDIWEGGELVNGK